jgi:hypothetical protein
VAGERERERCPLCGGANACAVAAQEGSECWCFAVELPAQIGSAAQVGSAPGACLCRACCEAQREAAA